MKQQRLLTIKEASDLLNLSVSRCYKLAERRILPGFRGVGRNNPWRFKYGDVFRLSIMRSFARMREKARRLLAEQGLDWLGRPLGTTKYGHSKRSGPGP